jgi:hypothetical protein
MGIVFDESIMKLYPGKCEEIFFDKQIWFTESNIS